MDFRKLLIFMFFIAIFTIGSVNANDNSTLMESNGEIIIDEPISVNIDDNMLESESVNLISNSDVDIYIHDKFYECDNREVVDITSTNNLANVTISVGDNVYFNKMIFDCNKSEFEKNKYSIFQNDLTPLLKIGSYNLTVKYDDGANPIIKTKSIEVTSPIDIDDVVEDVGYDEIIIRDNDMSGRVVVFIDSVQYYDKTFDGKNYVYIPWKDVNYDFKYKKYNIKVIYYKKNSEKPYICEKTVEFRYYMVLQANSVKLGCDLKINVLLPDDAKGTAIVKFNGKQYKVQIKKGDGSLKISAKNLKVGEYAIELSYSDSKYSKQSMDTSIVVAPIVTWPYSMSVGEDEYINILAHDGASGIVELYGGTWEDMDGDQYFKPGKLLKKVSIVDGKAKIPLNTFSKGYHTFALKYTIGKYTEDTIAHDSDVGGLIQIDILQNSKGFSAKLSAKKIKYGKNVVVKFKGKKTNKKVSIYVDDKKVNSIQLTKGKFKQSISGLSVGKHKIKVCYDEKNAFYSKTFYVKVLSNKKIKLKLKSISPKKSSKKVVLSATLKINKKIAKGKKITFKFSTKKYSTKTNKKGIAKVKIGKSALAKLDVGTAVEYMATYDKTNVKKSATVGK